jgi:hypothetical protein
MRLWPQRRSYQNWQSTPSTSREIEEASYPDASKKLEIAPAAYMCPRVQIPDGTNALTHSGSKTSPPGLPDKNPGLIQTGTATVVRLEVVMKLQLHSLEGPGQFLILSPSVMELPLWGSSHTFPDGWILAHVGGVALPCLICTNHSRDWATTNYAQMQETGFTARIEAIVLVGITGTGEVAELLPPFPQSVGCCYRDDEDNHAC